MLKLKEEQALLIEHIENPPRYKNGRRNHQSTDIALERIREIERIIKGK